MAAHLPIPLVHVAIEVDSFEFAAIRNWPFADPYVRRLLHHDIPQRVQSNECTIWAYRDPDGRFVGFGTLDLALDCAAFTAGLHHPYIPLLAVNPTIKSLGYGTSIVQHLVDEAALLWLRTTCSDLLFLDVYTNNARAIQLYEKVGFSTITPQPIADADEDGKSYQIMARRISVRSQRQ